jgi:hypothetical protein
MNASSWVHGSVWIARSTSRGGAAAGAEPSTPTANELILPGCHAVATFHMRHPIPSTLKPQFSVD